jgi:hypothetical protein
MLCMNNTPNEAPTCSVAACTRPAGRRTGGHPVHADMCIPHGGEVARFALWLGSSRLGGPDESFDAARSWWYRAWLAKPV